MQQRAEFLTGIPVGVAFERDTKLPDRLDQLECLYAFLFAYRVAEHLTKQADIVDERQFLWRNIVPRSQYRRAHWLGH